MRVHSTVVSLVFVSASAFGEVLLDQMDMVRHQSYSTASGNAIGGDSIFGNGKQVGLQLANDFSTTDAAYVITQVEVANLVFYPETRILDARVSIYPDNGGVPGEDPIYSERFSSIDDYSPALAPGIRNIRFDDGYFGFFGIWTVVSGLQIVLEPEQSYFICVQVCTGPDDWAYTIRDDVIIYGQDSYGRDGPPEEDECHCGWGSSQWQAFGESGRDAGDAAYRVVATGEASPKPEPDKVRRSELPVRKSPGHVERRQRREVDESESDLDP